MPHSPQESDVVSLPTRRSKVFNDPIHAHFTLHTPVLDALDTPHVQRLRDLKQLGGSSLVFPGATHSRFEHSLGVAHLSSKFITTLYNNNCDALATNHYDNHRHFVHCTQLVGLAGLCHDLGHGPFSHLFDYDFLPAVRRTDVRLSPLVRHEQRSVMLFQHMVDRFQIDLDREQIAHVGQLILGKAPVNSQACLTPRFLFDVVANDTTGIDTDKFDYLARDVYSIGLQGAYGFDYRRLIKFAKVIDDTICFHRKEIFNVYHLFQTRYQLHRTVYNHRVALSIDAMITDALLHADKTLKISDSIDDPTQFLRMTDALLPIIEFSTDKALETSRHILNRLRCRKLYKFVDEVLLPAGMERQISAQQITTHQSVAVTGVDLRPEDIHVAHVTLHFGMKHKNPVDNVLFFNDWDDVNPEHVSSKKESYVMPVRFQEKIIRIYLKRETTFDNNRAIQAAKIAFRNFLRSINVHSSITPASEDDDTLGAAPDPDMRARLPPTDAATDMNTRVAKRLRPCISR